MNKTQLKGRLTRKVELRYTTGENPKAVAKYTLAVGRGRKIEGQPDADFINIVAYGKAAEFADKYFEKGQQVIVCGRIRTGSYDDKDGGKKYTFEIVAEEQHFAEAKRNSTTESLDNSATEGFVPINQESDDDDDLPF